MRRFWIWLAIGSLELNLSMVVVALSPDLRSRALRVSFPVYWADAGTRE